MIASDPGAFRDPPFFTQAFAGKAMHGNLHAYLDNHRQQMFSALEKLVRINSGSRNKPGVDAVGRVIADALADCQLALETIESEKFGNTLIFRTPAAQGETRQVLLTGHMDTVFPPDTDFTEYREDGTRAYGPGVIDMKGGLVTGIFAIKTLAATGVLQQLPLAFVCTGDEEIGSPWSKATTQKEAQKSDCAFVLEVGGLNGEVVTGRKGNLSARLCVSGRAAHAAVAGPGKTSAIVEMAHKILAIEALNDHGDRPAGQCGYRYRRYRAQHRCRACRGPHGLSFHSSRGWPSACRTTVQDLRPSNAAGRDMPS